MIARDPHPPGAESVLELSVVMPCLNEAETLQICIEKAQQAFRQHQISGEVVVADNGSSDGSQEIAGAHSGARLIKVAKKGYGSALMGGITAARGKFVIMGDADDSYDFAHIPRFLGKAPERVLIWCLGTALRAGIAESAMPPCIGTSVIQL